MTIYSFCIFDIFVNVVDLNRIFCFFTGPFGQPLRKKPKSPKKKKNKNKGKGISLLYFIIHMEKILIDYHNKASAPGAEKQNTNASKQVKRAGAFTYTYRFH